MIVLLKPRPWWAFFMPQGVWFTTGPCIYYPRTFTNAVAALNRIEIIQHELVHVSQQQCHSRFSWLAKYFYSRSFRLQMEVAAIARECYQFHEDTKWVNATIDGYADALYGWGYFHAASSKQNAKDLITAALKRLIMENTMRMPLGTHVSADNKTATLEVL